VPLKSWARLFVLAVLTQCTNVTDTQMNGRTYRIVAAYCALKLKKNIHYMLLSIARTGCRSGYGVCGVSVRSRSCIPERCFCDGDNDCADCAHLYRIDVVVFCSRRSAHYKLFMMMMMMMMMMIMRQIKMYGLTNSPEPRLIMYRFRLRLALQT